MFYREGMMWLFPLHKPFVVTNDSQSFSNINLELITEVPIAPHVGSFGYYRKHHTHEGIDLYCSEGEPVFSVEDGTIVNIVPFTGTHANSPWWHETWAVMVAGKTGVVLYGEITPNQNLVIDQSINTNDLIGHVKQVLVKNKGRPMTMLHLELYHHGVTEPVCADHPINIEDTMLRDPTRFLINSKIWRKNEIKD